MAKNKLEEGVVGSKIVAWFLQNSDPNNLPNDAVAIHDGPAIKDQMKYRITFDNESVSDWLITFESGIRGIVITSAEKYNDVI